MPTDIQILQRLNLGNGILQIVLAKISDASLESFPASGSIIATNTAGVIRIEAAIADTRDGDFGGFDVTLLEGQPSIAGISFSTELDTTAATDTLEEVDPDLILDFVEDDDEIEFMNSDGVLLPEGDGSNYEADDYYDSFLLARDAANAAFALDECVLGSRVGRHDGVSHLLASFWASVETRKAPRARVSGGEAFALWVRGGRLSNQRRRTDAAFMSTARRIPRVNFPQIKWERLRWN